MYLRQIRILWLFLVHLVKFVNYFDQIFHISLLIFCLFGLSIMTEVCWITYNKVGLPVFFCSSINFYFIHCESILSDVYVFQIALPWWTEPFVMTLWLYPSLTVHQLSFWLVFAWHNIYHSFIFHSISMCFGYISYKQHVFGSLKSNLSSDWWVYSIYTYCNFWYIYNFFYHFNL